MNTEQKIDKQLNDNPVILYMKGEPDNPECGFSAKAVAALKSTGIPFAFVNVLQAPFIRERLPAISNWPTFPQLFIKGELIGGSDIIEAMHADGSLLAELDKISAISTKEAGGSIGHNEIEQLIKSVFADAKIDIEGEGCDLVATIISESFADLSMVKQQQGVMESLSEPLGNGRLHAITVKTYTPDQWRKIQPAAASDGLLQIQL